MLSRLLRRGAPGGAVSLSLAPVLLVGAAGSAHAFDGGGLLLGVRHGRDYAPLDGWWVFLGRLEGCLGRTIGRPAPLSAVTR